ncbi:MAG: alpha/beta fold hydrolase [Paracoccaceae bacterium]
MQMADLGDVTLHYDLSGPEDGPALVFANSLGCDFRLWDALLPHLPPSLRLLRYDKRGHGLSSCPAGPYSMGALVRDAEKLLDHLGLSEVVFVGLSIGGMIAQGLAVKRLDLVRGLVLSNTAAKIGQPAMWEERIAAVRAGGIEALADATMERWFSRSFRATPGLPGLAPHADPPAGRGLCRLHGGDLGHRFLYPHLRPAPAHPGHRRQRTARPRPTWCAKPPI